MRVVSFDFFTAPARRQLRWRNFWRGLLQASRTLVSHFASRPVGEDELRRADAKLNQAVFHRGAQGMRLR